MRVLLSLAVGVLLLADAPRAAPVDQQLDLGGEHSLDIVTQRSGQLQQSAAVTAPVTNATATAVTLEQVGDIDSFGRTVKYLGIATTTGVALRVNCAVATPLSTRCFPLQGGVGSFDEIDLGRIELPANASHSLLCFTLTPILDVQFSNPTANPRSAQMAITATMIIENPVLSDPALIDPMTGQPFGGQMNFSLSTAFEQRTLAAGAFDRRLINGTSRSCTNGLVSKQSLIRIGLTAQQATQFFKSPITVRFGSRVSVASAGFLDFLYGMRIYGD